jgi:ArsR family transcriptional regulator
MEATAALDRLGALAQETRLALFRLLVQQGPDGLAAGEIAAPNSRCRLPRCRSTSPSSSAPASSSPGAPGARSATRTNFGAVEELLAYLYQNCCQGGLSCPPDSALVTLSGVRKGKIQS